MNVGTAVLWFILIGLIIINVFFAFWRPAQLRSESEQLHCPVGTELIRGEMTDWFCATRPTLKKIEP